MELPIILLAFGAMISWGIGDFLIQKSTRKIGDIESLAWIGIIGSIILLPLVLKDLHLISKDNFGILFILGVIDFFVSIGIFEALKKGKLSVVDVILEIELPATLILGIIFLNEKLSWAVIGLISLIFVGTSIIAFEHKKIHKKLRLFEKGAILAFFAAVGMSAVNVLTGFGAKNISPLIVIWLPWLILSFLCLLQISRTCGLKIFLRNAGRHKKLILGMSFFDTIAWLFYALALSKNEVAIITAITESYPMIAIFLGLWFNRERIFLHQYIGAAITLGASITIALIS